MTKLPLLEDLDDKDFNPFEIEDMTLGTCEDPYPIFKKKREEASVHKAFYRDWFTDIPDAEVGDLNHYTVLSYDAVKHIYDHPETFTNKGAFEHFLGKSFGKTLSAMDPPEHGKYRKVIQKAFMPHIVAKWGDSVVAPTIENLLSPLLPKGEADLVQDFTIHFPFQVIYRQLELEAEEATKFQKLALTLTAAAQVGAPQGPEATRKLGEFFAKFIEIRRAEPAQDLVSHLVTVEADGEMLDDEFIISFLRQLMNAGGDTTYRGFSVLLTNLLRNPDQLEAVRNDRSLIPQAIAESLRWDPPVLTSMRYVMHDTEIDGVFIPEGSIVDVSNGAANRDPAAFENPDKFDIFRDTRTRSFAFAGGPHVCAGQHLARVELTRGLNAILDEMPNLRLDPDKPAPVIRGHMLRVPEYLYVKFDAK